MPEMDRTCPICGRKSATSFAPFCSKRCGDVDLNRWLGEHYSIPTRDDEDYMRDPVNDNVAPNFK